MHAEARGKVAEAETVRNRGAEQMKRIEKLRNRGRKGLGFVAKKSEEGGAFEERKQKELHQKIRAIEREDKNRYVSVREERPEEPSEDRLLEEDRQLSRFTHLKSKKLTSRDPPDSLKPTQ